MSESSPVNPPSANEDSARRYRPVDLGRIVGLSASQVRNYEKVGFLPPAPRTNSGYRSYGDQHATALRVARCLKKGYGWDRALAAMQAVHDNDPDRALAVADERHADLHAQRQQIIQALTALDKARRDSSIVLGLHLRQGRTVSIGQAATALGVNTSAIRYWESRGVLTPTRGPGGHRRYDRKLLQQLELVKLLRDINYDFIAITAAVSDLSDNGPKARQALEHRQISIQQASRASAQATQALVGYIELREQQGLTVTHRSSRRG